MSTVAVSQGSPTSRFTVVRQPLATTESWIDGVARRKPSLERWSLWVLALVILLVLWQIGAMILDDPLFLPSVPVTFEAGWELFVTQRSIYDDILTTAREWGVGFLLSLTAIPIGLFFGMSRRFRLAARPFAAALYAMPHIAFIPLGIVWFGLGIQSKVFIVFISVFFMVLITILAGVESLDGEFRNIAAAFGISRLRTFLTVIVPGSVPFIASGLQLGVGKALTAVIAAELLGGNTGLGYSINVYSNQFKTAQVFVLIAFLAITGALLTQLMEIVGRQASKWQVTSS